MGWRWDSWEIDGIDGTRPSYRWEKVGRSEEIPPASHLGHRPYLGRTTVSITWMTPLLVSMSVFTTLASLIFTPSAPALTLSSWPFTVLAFIVFTSAAMTFPGTT